MHAPLLSRREWLSRSIAVAGTGVAMATLSSLQAITVPVEVDIGLQFYTLGDDVWKDIDATLQTVRRIGYRKVEIGGLGGLTGKQFKAKLDAAGLICRSATIPGQSLGAESLDQNIDGLIHEFADVGIDYIVMPIMLIPQRLGPPVPMEHFALVQQYVRANRAMTAEDWKDSARFVNEKGAILKKAGMKIGYHNHNFEFLPIGSTNGMEIMLNETDPDLVTFEMDAGWVAAAGHDPRALLARYPGRFKLMHVKDILPSTKPNYDMDQAPCSVGKGIIDWKTLLPAAVTAGVEHFYVEQEPPYGEPRITAVTNSYRYLSSLKF
jgi:sugar phosphate isomerase/epimerase